MTTSPGGQTGPDPRVASGPAPAGATGGAYAGDTGGGATAHDSHYGAGAQSGAPTAAATDSDHRDPSQVSVGQLMGEISNDLSTLMRQELQLAKAELTVEAKKAGPAAGMLAGAGYAGHLLVLFVSLAVWGFLSGPMGWGWSAVVVAAFWAVVAAVLAAQGRSKLRQVNPKPEKTVETIQEIPAALKGQAGSHR
ncbi:hypothetical protein BH24ACT12_BH24ACT12_16660 [soil metagenome]